MARAKGSSAPPTPARPSTKAAPGAPVPKALTPEELYRMIQETAYFKAKARDFAPGHELQDWVEAEAEVRRQLERRA